MFIREFTFCNQNNSDLIHLLNITPNSFVFEYSAQILFIIININISPQQTFNINVTNVVATITIKYVLYPITRSIIIKIKKSN